MAIIDTPETARHFVFVTQCIFCSMYAVVIWDWLTSLPREYRLVWQSKWTAVKGTYLFCRYWVIIVGCFLLYCFVGNHSEELCNRIYRIPVALAMWNQLSSELILLLRTYALFGRSLGLAVFLGAALAGVSAYQLYVATSQMLPLPFIPPATTGPCLPQSKPHAADLLGFFIAPLLYDTLVTILTVCRAFVVRKRSGGHMSSIITTFVKEGVFYYILISIANLINGIFYLQPRVAMSALCIPLSVMLGPVMACRLILDLRQQAKDGSGVPQMMTSSGPPVTPIVSRRAPNNRFSRSLFNRDAQGGTVEMLDFHESGNGHDTIKSITRSGSRIMRGGKKGESADDIDPSIISGIKVNVDIETSV